MDSGENIHLARENSLRGIDTSKNYRVKKPEFHPTIKTIKILAKTFRIKFFRTLEIKDF
jgi:hypothetical protein